eukprot:scaffold48276_cov21-Tisochrysis_lutea.AAC.1
MPCASQKRSPLLTCARMRRNKTKAFMRAFQAIPQRAWLFHAEMPHFESLTVQKFHSIGAHSKAGMCEMPLCSQPENMQHKLLAGRM